MNVICIDPGDTTGFFIELDGHVTRLQSPEWSALDSLTGLLDGHEIDAIVIEAFNLYDPRPKANAGWALDVIGAARWEARQREIPVVMQTTKEKTKITDEMLDRMGLLLRPKKTWRHTNDAARHYVLYMNRK